MMMTLMMSCGSGHQTCTVLCRALYTKGLRPSQTVIGWFRVIVFAVTPFGSTFVTMLPRICTNEFEKFKIEDGSNRPSKLAHTIFTNFTETDTLKYPWKHDLKHRLH